MEVTAWIAGFVAFILGAFHLSLYSVFRARFHLWLAVGWLGNIFYVYLEERVSGTPEFAWPFLTSVTLLLFFALARQDLQPVKRLRFLIEISSGLAITALFFTLGSVRHTSFVAVLGGAFFHTYVFSTLGLSFWRMEIPEIKRIFLGERADLLYPQDENTATKFLPVDALMLRMRKRAALIAKRGKIILAISFIGFGTLQLAYPFGESIKHSSPQVWAFLFDIGMAFKFATGIGFVVLLVSHARLVEILGRQVTLSSDLAKIMASVEHDIRGPIGEIGIVSEALSLKANDNNPKYTSFLRDQCSYLDYIQAKAGAVVDMILAMRALPANERRPSSSHSIGEPVGKAIRAVRILHPDVKPVINLDGFAPNQRVFGDPLRLAQAIRNVLNNAVEAVIVEHPNRRPMIAIRSWLSRDDDCVYLSIRDEGPGIPPDILPTVTEAGVSTKFGDGKVNRGMGLYISKRLIDIHGGTLKIKCHVDGTEVLIGLPRG